jgi:hypothetical protein
MAAEISGRTGGSGTASMPPAAAPKTPQPGIGPARSDARTGQSKARAAHPEAGAGVAAQGCQPSRPPLQSEDELEAVKRYVLLGIAVRILDHDIRVVDSSRLKLPRFYESILRGLQDRALLELAALRRMFRASGIKVYEERKEEEGLTAAYVCRGYHHHFTMPWSFVRAEAERLLKRYAAPD